MHVGRLALSSPDGFLTRGQWQQALPVFDVVTDVLLRQSVSGKIDGLQHQNFMAILRLHVCRLQSSFELSLRVGGRGHDGSCWASMTRGHNNLW